jgi:uncharacterized protein with GYD domain
MSTFIATVKFTAQGAQGVKNTCQRAEEFKSAAQKLNVQVREIYWTLGPADGVLVFDAPDESTATAAMLQLSSKGNVTTQTARAFTAAEMQEILAQLPG